MDPFVQVARRFIDRGIRFVVIGVWGANYYAADAAAVFTTKDRDLFLPLDPDNLLHAWRACEDAGLSLTSNGEPLDLPRDRVLAERVIERRALVRAADDRGLLLDLSLVMGDLDFETAWNERRTFAIEGVEIPVARLLHIVKSKASAARDKDRLFLATHRQALEDMLKKDW